MAEETICCEHCGHEYDRHIGSECPNCGHNNHDQMVEIKTYTIPKFEITVTVSENGLGEISSGLKEVLIGSEPSENDFEILGAVQALESLILGHACAGLDISSPAYVAGLETSLEALANNL